MPQASPPVRGLADSVIMVILAVLYGAAAFVVFCSSGLFGNFGENSWRDTALLAVTLTASCALTYISMLYYGYWRRRPNSTGDPEALEWHFLIPCRDEENVVAATISSARTSFPFAHVWVIDDASEDGTAAVVTRAMAFDDKVHLISRVRPEARIGKGEALNYAFSVVSDFVGNEPSRRAQTVIGILDADGYLSDDALKFLAGPESFGDPAVGAAQLEVWMKNRDDRRPLPERGLFANVVARYLIRMQDLEFRATNSAMQALRVRTGTVGMGGNGQFTRMSVLDQVAEKYGKPWGNKLAEDYELGLRILGLGWRNHYVPEGHVSQEALPFTQRLLTQRTRWAQGNMECASLLPELRRAKALKFSGALEIHYFMAQPLIMMVNLVLVPVLTYFAVIDGRFGLATGAEVLVQIAVAAVFLFIPYASWGVLYRGKTREEGRGFGGIFLGIGALIYLYATYLYYPRAMARLLTGRNAWAKTARNMDGRNMPALASIFDVRSLPVLDRAALAQLATDLGSRQLATNFANAFAMMWPRRMARLEEAVAAGNHEQARDAAGSIQVSAAMVGAAQLEASGAQILAVAQAGDPATAHAALVQLHQIGDAALDSLRDLRLEAA